MKRLFACSALVALLTACAPSSETEAPETETPAAEDSAVAEATDGLLMPLPTTAAEITADDIRARIATLADDIFEGRGPGTPAGEATADWVAAEMERIGLIPANNGSWFQTVEMVNQTIDTDASSLTISSSQDAEPFAIGPEAVIWTKRQLEMDQSFEGSEVVFVGYGAVAPEYGWNDYEGLDVEGKTVIILVNDPGFATQDPDLFNGNAMTYYGRWTYKFEEAARQGATAAIIVHQTEPAAYGWDVVQNSWTGAQADLVYSDGGASRAMMEGWITESIARALFEEAGLDFDELTASAAQPGFSYVDMGDLTASGRIVQTVEYAESRNVLGMIEGTEVPDEFVLFTAHWDHLGNAADPSDPNFSFATDDTIYNGAVDNATGASALLEIAEAMAAEAPSRSVLFAAVTLEESGLLGSAYMAENEVIPSHQIVAGINMDGMLPTGPTNDMVVVGYGASELEDILTDVLEADGRVVRPDPLPQNGYFYRSDHVSYAKIGIPMLYADAGDDMVEGGRPAGAAAAAEYTALRYHKPQDEYDPSWDLSGMEQNVTALFEVGRRISQSDEWPTWYEGNEFESIRQADLAAHAE